MFRAEEAAVEWATLRPEKEEGEKAEAEVMAMAASESFMLRLGELSWLID